MAAVKCCSTKFKWSTCAITDSIKVTAVSTTFSGQVRLVRDCSVSLNMLKYMKTLDSCTSDFRHILYPSHHSLYHEAPVWQWSHWHRLLRTLPYHQQVLQHLCPPVTEGLTSC
jgi:hypothetical protein